MSSAEGPARARELTALTDELTALAARITAALDARQPLPPELMESQAQLSTRYRAEMTREARDPSLLRTAPLADRQALEAAGARLRAAHDAMQKKLAVLKTLSEGLAQAMAEEAARHRKGPLGYDERGASAAGGSPAVAVNQKV